MNTSLEDYLRSKLHVLEKKGYYQLSTDTVRCWIDVYNEQINLKQEVKTPRVYKCPKCNDRLLIRYRDGKQCSSCSYII